MFTCICVRAVEPASSVGKERATCLIYNVTHSWKSLCLFKFKAPSVVFICQVWQTIEFSQSTELILKSSHGHRCCRPVYVVLHDHIDVHTDLKTFGWQIRISVIAPSTFIVIENILIFGVMHMARKYWLWLATILRLKKVKKWKTDSAI